MLSAESLWGPVRPAAQRVIGSACRTLMHSSPCMPLIRRDEYTHGSTSVSSQALPPKHDAGGGDDFMGTGGASPSLARNMARALMGLRGYSNTSGVQIPQNRKVESEEEAAMKLEQRRRKVQAGLEAGTLGLGLSAGGFLYCYHLGVLWELHDLGLLNNRLNMAGASAGSLAIATYHSGIGVQEATKALHEFAAECRTGGTSFRLGPLLLDFLHAYLPADAHERCRGVCHVALTRLFPYLTPEVISEFDSKDDFISALITSCHIPMYADGRWAITFRERYYMDGGATNFIPRPLGAEEVVKVCCFPVNDKLESVVRPTLRSMLSPSYMDYAHSLLDISISPDAFSPFPHSYSDILQWAMLPAPDEVLQMLVQRGRQDARAWAELMQLVSSANGRDYPSLIINP